MFGARAVLLDFGDTKDRSTRCNRAGRGSLYRLINQMESCSGRLGGASLVAFQMGPVGRRISVWNGQLALSFLPEIGAIAASSLATLL